MEFLLRRHDMVKKFASVSDSHDDMRLRSRAITLSSPRKGQTTPSSEPDEKLLEKNQETREICSSRFNVKLGSKDAAAESPRTRPPSKDYNTAELRSTPKSVSKSSKVVEVDERSPSKFSKPQKSTNMLKETPKSAKNGRVDVGTPKSAKNGRVDVGTPKSAKNGRVDVGTPKSAKNGRVDVGTPKSAKNGGVDMGTPKPAKNGAVDVGTPKSTKNGGIDVGTPKSAKNGAVDVGTPKSIKSTAIKGTDEVTPKPRITRARKNLDDSSSTTPKASGNTGASESTEKSKSSADEGLRTPRKARSNQPVQMPVHSPSDDDFIDLKTRASSKTKEMVSKPKTPLKNSKSVAKLPESNGEVSHEENDATETKLKRLVSKRKNGTTLEVPSVSSKRKNGVALENLSSGKNREVKKKRNDEEIANGVETESDESGCDSESSSSKFHLWPPLNA